ncbi:hypothetical protein NKI79_32630, partial [Mesorhizobium sp. M0340]|uniref:hypothetical protein n=1 Tax=Mesorhizobium sp. M0340 TaxID=2956939 RepID=UPI003339F54D
GELRWKFFLHPLILSKMRGQFFVSLGGQFLTSPDSKHVLVKPFGKHLLAIWTIRPGRVLRVFAQSHGMAAIMEEY